MRKGEQVLPSGPTADAGLAMLRGGAVPAALVAAVVTLVSVRWGTAAVLGAVTGGVLVMAAMSVGPLLLHAAHDWSPPAVMAIATIGYGGAVVALGVAYMVLAQVPWLTPEWLGATLIAGTIGWLAGQLWATARLRVLAFDDPSGPADGAAG